MENQVLDTERSGRAGAHTFVGGLGSSKYPTHQAKMRPPSQGISISTFQHFSHFSSEGDFGMVRLSATSRQRIIELARKVWSKQQIRNELNVGRAAVDLWMAPARTDPQNLADGHRSGRPSKLMGCSRYDIKERAKKGHSAVKIARSLSKHGYAQVHAKTVVRALKGGYKPLFYQHVKVVRVLSERNQIQRQRFCKPFSAAGKGSLVFVNGQDSVSIQYREGRPALCVGPNSSTTEEAEGPPRGHSQFLRSRGQRAPQQAVLRAS